MGRRGRGGPRRWPRRAAVSGGTTRGAELASAGGGGDAAAEDLHLQDHEEGVGINAITGGEQGTREPLIVGGRDQVAVHAVQDAHNHSLAGQGNWVRARGGSLRPSIEPAARPLGRQDAAQHLSCFWR